VLLNYKPVNTAYLQYTDHVKSVILSPYTEVREIWGKILNPLRMESKVGDEINRNESLTVVQRFTNPHT
jgi:hypothetical protein